jgi:hypothetical protein
VYSIKERGGHRCSNLLQQSIICSRRLSRHPFAATREIILRVTPSSSFYEGNSNSVGYHSTKMSAEVVKKRGRPKKVVSEPIAAESMEPVKKGTRQKSTKASAPLSATTSNEAAKLPMATAEDASITSIAAQKKTNRIKSPTVSVNTSSSPPTTPPEAISETLPAPTKSPTKSSPPKVTPANSKILNQVRALSSKAPSAGKSSSAASKSPNPTSPASPTTSKNTKSLSQTNATKPSASEPSSKPSLPKAEQEHPVSSQSDVLNASLLQPSPIPSTSQPHAQQPQKRVPIAALNSSIVSQISSRAGARPGRPPTDLPVNYKPVARRVTLAIVALPIAIVTSWVLYQRRKF